MSLIVEDGFGILSANGNMTVDEFKAYHASRGNDLTPYTDPDLELAIIKATDYIEQRFAQRFKGRRCFTDLTSARSTLSTFGSQPTDGDTIVAGSVTYTWRNTPSLADDVQIGDTTLRSLQNLAEALQSNDDVRGGVGTSNRLLFYAVKDFTEGNGFPTVTDTTGWSTNFPVTTGGSDTRQSQPLSFPRAGLVDRDGQRVLEMPDKLKNATAEYGFRALTTILNPDPTYDATGRVVNRKKEKVGPIEEETEFEPGGGTQLRAYPSADAWLADYLVPTGGAMR